eukprot:493005_1
MHNQREMIAFLSLLWIHINVICQLDGKCFIMGATYNIIMLIKLSLYRTLELDPLAHCKIFQILICGNTSYKPYNLRFGIHLVCSNICLSIHPYHALFLGYDQIELVLGHGDPHYIHITS